MKGWDPKRWLVPAAILALIVGHALAPPAARRTLYLGIAAVAALLVLALAVAAARFNHRRREVSRAAARLTDDELERIYELVEGAGPERSRSYVLARTHARADAPGDEIGIPPDAEGFPWAGQRIVVRTGDEVDLSLAAGDPGEPRVGGRNYRLVRVPMRRTRAGRPRCIWSPDRYLAASPELAERLSAACPGPAVHLLSYLLCIGRDSFEFEPVEQGRVAASPAWVHAPEWPECSRCATRLRMIVQLPGGMLGSSRHASSTFYLFGCPTHPELTQTVWQST